MWRDYIQRDFPPINQFLEDHEIICNVIFVIVFCNSFKSLFPKWDANFDMEPIKCWNLSFSSHKVPYHFCKIQDSFVERFRCMITWNEPNNLNIEPRKGQNEKHYNYIKLYGFEGGTHFLPIFVSDWHFLIGFFKEDEK